MSVRVGVSEAWPKVHHGRIGSADRWFVARGISGYGDTPHQHGVTPAAYRRSLPPTHPHRPDIDSVAPGTVMVTTAGALTESNNVRHIIDVAAVHGEPGAGFRQAQNIGWCVTNALIEAERLAGSDEQIRTILIPLRGTFVGE